MPSFSYRGFDKAGGRVSGTLTSVSAESALRELQTQGFIVSDIAPADQAVGLVARLGLVNSSRVGIKEVEFLTSELALLLDNGVRIDRAVEILRKSGRSPAMARMLESISDALKKGQQFSEALAAHPIVFDQLYVNLVALGESGGQLPRVFRGLADELKFRRELRQKLVSAATYPAVVAGVCVLAVLFIFNFVVPNLAGLFADAVDLPWYTTMLLSSSAFMQQWQVPLFLLIAGLGLAAWQQRNRPAFVAARDDLVIRAPGLRDTVLTLERVRFASGLSLLLESGLPVDKALSLAADNVAHSEIRRELLIAIEKVKRGEQISKAMRQTRLFPDYFASLVEVGEESASLDRVFREIANRSRDDFSTWAIRLTSILEPLLILIMGLIVGGVVVVMMLSITSVTDVGI